MLTYCSNPTCCICIFQWTELLISDAFPNNERISKLEDIKDKFLQFNAIRLLWSDSQKLNVIQYFKDTYLDDWPVWRSVKGIFFFAIWWGRSRSWLSQTFLRKSRVKKWLQMFPALNVSFPSSVLSSDVSLLISLYSTTWEFQETTKPSENLKPHLNFSIQVTNNSHCFFRPTFLHHFVARLCLLAVNVFGQLSSPELMSSQRICFTLCSIPWKLDLPLLLAHCPHNKHEDILHPSSLDHPILLCFWEPNTIPHYHLETWPIYSCSQG